MSRWIRARIRIGHNTGGTVKFEQAFADFLVHPKVTIRVGQFSAPLLMNDDPSPELLNMADFDAMANAFTAGISRGGMVQWTPVNDFRGTIMAMDGLRTAFSEVGTPVNADIAGLLRFEGLPLHGSFDRFADPASWLGSPLRLRLGTSLYGQSGGRTGNTTKASLSAIAADAQLEGNGYAVQLVGTWFRIWAPELPPINDFGVALEGSYFVIDRVQLVARLDGVYPGGVHPPPLPTPGNTKFRTASAGINFFLIPRSHFAKLQFDFTYMFDPQSTSLLPISSNSGIFSTTSGPQWTSRVQLTLSL